ncbi:hypothetical protein AWR36_008510 [Microbulbifer flavimaris]|uniref:Uncharacterized protein n=1 Tax=Microbulbifer flavimaris TaxID=1781068 RepID=A0ABX4I0U5_9GAMM|nr:MULTISPECIES: hypothetical protein [Microbulbifer]KUJ83847.1 hypothetical protein AVO43_08480 [Microbulbifer sp. ZGT114]PCO06024.1 hypothetical protein AWR36_008510 [Microbulbifer flavimaris]
MKNLDSVIRTTALGWFCFCYFFSLLLIPVFPFVTVGFDWKIAMLIVFISPLLFLLQGFLIGSMVWLGLQIYRAGSYLLCRSNG